MRRKKNGDKMKLEDKVATFEQAKKLDELGVVLETEKKWFCETQLDNWPTHVEVADCYVTPTINFPAPDVAELGELLPKTLGIIDQFEIRIEHDSGCWLIDYYDHYEKYLSPMPDFIAETEAQARCAALIWLIENNYLEVE